MHLGKESSSCQIKWNVLHVSREQFGWISQSRCFGAFAPSNCKTEGSLSGLRQRMVTDSSSVSVGTSLISRTEERQSVCEDGVGTETFSFC